MADPVYTAYREGYEYGMGVFTAKGFRAGLAVEGEVSGVQNAVGGSGKLTILRIETTEKLEKALGISAEASGGVGLFSANVRFDFAKECEVQSSSIILLLADEIRFGFTQIDRPKLFADLAVGVRQNPQLFQQRYGDLFCIGMSTGGIFYAVLKIECASETSKQDINASMGGSYGLAFSAEAQLHLSESLQRTRSSVEIKIYHEGGTLRGHENPMTPEQVLSAHASWYRSLVDGLGHATDLAKPYQVQLSPYAIAEGPPPPNEADFQNQKDVLMRCAELRSEVLDRLNLVSYILSHPNYYNYGPNTATVDGLASLKTSLANDLQHIARTASHAINNITNATQAEAYPPPNGSYKFAELPANLPPLQGATPIQVPNFAGCNGRIKIMELAASKSLTAQVIATAEVGSFRVTNQKPPAGEAVPPGGTVSVFTTKAAPQPIRRTEEVRRLIQI